MQVLSFTRAKHRRIEDAVMSRKQIVRYVSWGEKNASKDCSTGWEIEKENPTIIFDEIQSLRCAKKDFFFPSSLSLLLQIFLFSRSSQIPSPSSNSWAPPGSQLLIPTPSSGLLVISLIPIVLNSKLCLSFSVAMNRILLKRSLSAIAQNQF